MWLLYLAVWLLYLALCLVVPRCTLPSRNSLVAPTGVIELFLLYLLAGYCGDVVGAQLASGCGRSTELFFGEGYSIIWTIQPERSPGRLVLKERTGCLPCGRGSSPCRSRRGRQTL